MAKKEITLTREQWAVVVTTVKGAPAGRDVETQYKQNKLRVDLITGLNAGGDTVALLGWQRKMIDAILATPATPWRLEFIPKVWDIREAFGFRRPTAEDFDDEED